MNRGYEIRDFSFNYDAERDSTANGFVSLGDSIPPGFTIIDAATHGIVTVTTAGGAAQFVLSNGTFNLAGEIQESSLGAGRRSDVSFFTFPPVQFNDAQNPFGLVIANGPILTGKFDIVGNYVIITE